ncbi:MAG: hypothetical protein H6737_28550 [Alphaproteobacteria bacterium]|nr:hypothetical protein [Alphaproteobacteria bacterium]
MRRWILVASVVAVSACEIEEGGEGRAARGGRYDPPSEPAHTVSQEGVMHARGYDTPYLCGDPSGRRTTCPDDIRPARADLSCDASGCHGDYTYSPDFAQADRHLLGSDGPSCFTCHGQRWSEQRAGQAVAGGAD